MVRWCAYTISLLFIKVSFVGEEAVDTGGPSREYWRIIMHDIKQKYCHGQDGKLVFNRNILALQVY